MEERTNLYTFHLEDFLKYRGEKSTTITSSEVKIMPITICYDKLLKPREYSLEEDMREAGFSDVEIQNRVPLAEDVKPIARTLIHFGVSFSVSTLGFYGIGESIMRFPNQEWLTGLSFFLFMGGLLSTVFMWRYDELNPTESREKRIRKTAEANRFYKEHGIPKKGLENYTLDSL